MKKSHKQQPTNKSLSSGRPVFERPNCKCPYNHDIADGFDEAFIEKYSDDLALHEFFHALMHSNNFEKLIDAVDTNPATVLADAVRFGWEAGPQSLRIQEA